MKKERAIKLAYAAGIIDADGCISLTRVKKYERFQVCMNSTDGRMIDWLYGNFGGSVLRYQPYQENRKTVYRWNLTSEKAYQLCKDLIPFLKYKTKQAEIALRFWNDLRKHSTCYKNGRPYRLSKLSNSELVLRDQLIKEMKIEKDKFIPPKCKFAAVENKRDESDSPTCDVPLTRE
jgi:hypothetical protein